MDACCDRCSCCCKHYVWGEALFLRARDAEVAFATPIDGPIRPEPGNYPVQVGPVGLVDPDFEPGFRVGFATDLDCCARIGAEYTRYESGTSHAVETLPVNVLASHVVHPGTLNAIGSFYSGEASLDIGFDLVDLDYRCVFASGDCYEINYLAGLRYGHLDQEFRSQFTNNGVEEVDTNIRFDGGGLRFGLEAERHSCCTGLMVYGKAIGSFAAGDFRADYRQMEATDSVVVDTSWKSGRVVGMADFELGAGWMSCNGCLRVTGGYMLSTWYNTVQTDEYIHAVRRNHFVGLGDNMTFDGFVARVEARF